MNPINLYLSLICGVLPYERLNSQINKFQSYGQMYIAPAIYLICFGIIKFGSFGITQQSECKSICRLVYTLFMYMGLGMYVIMHSLTLLRGKKFYIEFEKLIAEIDERLLECNVLSIEKKDEKRTKYWYFATWSTVIACFTVTIIFDIKQLLFYYREYFFIVFMVSTFPYTATSLVLGQFSYFVDEISKRFHMVNELLEKLKQEAENKHAPIMIFDIETEVKKNAPLNQQLRHRHNANSGSVNEESDDFNDDVNDLKNADTMPADGSEVNLHKLFRLHDKILSLSVITNAEYGPQCVPYMAVCFVITIYGIFLLVKVFIEVGGKNRLLDYVSILYCLWSITTLLVAYLLLRHTSIANSHSKESAMIIQAIMLKKPAFMLGNDAYYNKMKSFNFQYLHWDRYFQFNGIGLFFLDYTFVFSILSAATSYLIVLLQFDMTAIFTHEGLI